MTESTKFDSDVRELLAFLSDSDTPAPICDAVDNLLKHAEKLARDKAALLAACEDASFLFAHGVGAMAGSDSNKERNIGTAIAIKIKLAKAIDNATNEAPND